MIPKGFPHHLRHFFRLKSTEFTQFGPHFEACSGEFSCVLATPRSENSVFLENTFQRQMWCQHWVLTWSWQYFWNKSLYRKCFWKQSEPSRCRLDRDTAQFPTPKWPHKKGRWEGQRVHGGQKIEIFSKFFLCSEMIPRGFPHHLRDFSHPNSTNFTHFGPHFEACSGEFSCVLAIARSENSVFLENTFPR